MPNRPFPALRDLAAAESELELSSCRALELSSFTDGDAWTLGCAQAARGRETSAPIAIDITRSGHLLCHVALPGGSPDNAVWIERKSRTVAQFGHSSLFVGQLGREAGTTFEAKLGLDPGLYAAAGGAFPVVLAAAGPIRVVVVSGLPQGEDRQLVTSGLRRLMA